MSARAGWTIAAAAAACALVAPAAARAHALTPDPAAAAAGEAGAARFAIVIGNNRPEDGDASRVPSLRYADDDAVATHALLIEAGVTSVLLARLDDDSRRLHPGVRPDGAPRADELDRALAAQGARMKAAAARGARVELLLFYSGHGDVERGEGYVVLEDGRLTRTMLYALLARSPAARNHVFIDACKSYFLAFEKGPGGTRRIYTHAFVADAVPSHLANTGFVLSTSSGRDSHEWERYQAGILSHEVRSALRGAADADRDGRVTYAELGAFLAVANDAITNGRFRPDFMVRPPGRDLAEEVLRWSPASATTTTTVRVEGAAVGHVYVETAHGERVLDAHPADGQPLTLHVPVERPLFVRRHDETAEQVVIERAPPPITSLAPAAPEIAMRGALHLAFEQLFDSPFAESSVRDFARGFDAREAAGVARAVASAPAAPARDTRHALRLVAGATVLAGAAVGVGLGAFALERYADGGRASQVELASTNASVRRLDIAAAVSFAIAGAAGLTWAIVGGRGDSRDSVSVAPAVGAAGPERGMSIVYSGALP
jgi:hypothetical protein